MIYIIHGENLSSLRNFILSLRKKLKAKSRVEVSISDFTPVQLSEVCGSFDMFGNAPFVVLDISKMGRMKVDGYIEVAEKIPEEATLVVLSLRELGSANTFIKNSVRLRAKVMKFAESPKANVFKFVDAVYSRKRKASYKELRNLLLSGADVFYVFSMLLYGLRTVSYSKFSSPSLERFHPFVKKKLVDQSSNFSEWGIKEIYRGFYQLDKDVKGGQVQQEMLLLLAIEKVFSSAT